MESLHSRYPTSKASPKESLNLMKECEFNHEFMILELKNQILTRSRNIKAPVEYQQGS